jgi:hypothetical protein
MPYQPWPMSRAKERVARLLRRRRVWPVLSRTFPRSAIDASVRLVSPHERIGEADRRRPVESALQAHPCSHRRSVAPCRSE